MVNTHLTKSYLASFPFASPTYDESVGLRYEVLRKPLGLEFSVDQLVEEWDQMHLGVFSLSDELLGCLILKRNDDSGSLKMRQVAIRDRYRGLGLGAELVKFSERIAKTQGFNEIVLHAREESIPFYLKLGYRRNSVPFQEVGIPHSAMIKNL